MMRLWERLQGSCVIGEFDHVELEPTSHASPGGKDKDIEGYFADAPAVLKEPEDTAPSQVKEATKKMQRWLAELEKVQNENEFTGYTPKSMQELAAERILLRDMHETGSWHLVDDARQASLLPVGYLVRHVLSDTHFFVMKTYASAAVLWLAKRLEIGLWEPDLSVDKLEWRTCFDVNDYEEMPIITPCPLRMFIEDFLVSFGILYVYIYICVSYAAPSQPVIGPKREHQ